MSTLKLFFACMLGIFVMDMLWLGIIAKSLYAASLDPLLRKSADGLDPNWYAAILVYIAIAAGIVLFVIPKANNEIYYALYWGIAFGAITYGVYDFTNFSILREWPLSITLIDFGWGMTLCGLGSALTQYIKNTFIA